MEPEVTETEPTTEPTETEVTTDADYTEQLDRIVELLEKFDTYLDYFVGASGIVSVYGYIFVPLVFICSMLWWFFRQFLERYR